MPGYVHSPRIADVERSLPGITRLVERAGLGAEMRALTEMMDRRDRDLELRHLNPPSCRVYRSTDQNLTALAFTALSFSALRWDSTNGGMWASGAPTVVVAPEDGVYAAGFGVSTNATVYSLLINATIAGVVYTYAATGGAGAASSLHTEIAMKKGDSVIFYVLNSDAVGRLGQALARSSMEAYLTWLRPGVL